MKLPFVIFCIFIALPEVAIADEYKQLVKDALRERCFACHGALKQEAGLRVDAVHLMKEGGDSGSAIVAGESEASLLVERISAEDDEERMPPEGKPLTGDEIAAIRKWIDAGAAAPADDEPESDPRAHWSFQRLRRTPPHAESHPSIANEVDAHLHRLRREHGVRVVGPAPRDQLLRRVYIDLIGLPPSRDDLRQFLNDDRPDAYERVVDRLLGSPLHGERWGRHWMDVWRYTDWYGLGAQLRNSQKHIWHWRDWIVESLNANLGYDEMVRLMLAADELRPADRDSLRATGFLARNYYLFNRDTWLDDTIEHTSKAFMGLTMNCCRCHDHKYDPLLQRDYYAFRAIFEPHHVRLDPLPGATDLEIDGLPRVFDAHLDASTYLFIRGDTKNPDKSEVLRAAVPEVLNVESWQPVAVDLPTEAHRPSLQPFVLEDHLAKAQHAIDAAQKAVTEAEQRRSRAQRQTNLAKEAYTAFKFDDTSPWADDFDKPNPSLWKIELGTWKYEDGDVKQTESGLPRRYIRSHREHPTDFITRLRFTTTSGDKWRSVGVCFDSHDGHEKMVYMSAVQPGSKVQYSYGANGQLAYPAEGLVARPVNVGETYEMTFAVRGDVLNVAVDGKHVLAYKMPGNRQAGVVDITAFDAVTTFHDFRLQALPDDVKLFDPTGESAIPSPEEADAMLQVARAKLKTAQLHPLALKTAFAADQTQYGMSDRAVEADAKSAAAAARAYELATAEAALADAKLALLQADASTKKKAQEDVTSKTAAWEQAEAAAKNSGEKYTSLRASLKALEGPADTEASRRRDYPTTSSGRRTAFARWLTSCENPLAARVAVNHIWLRHFGQPLVDPVNDFGLRTQQPLQHALLDHLAVDFMTSNWDMKRLHRRLVTSAAYQLSSSTREADATTQAKDGSNACYWRRLPSRMESQVVRDSLLHLATSLDLELGGPAIKPQAKNVTLRRSLYFTRSRDDHDVFLKTFDDADILRCYRRSASIVPQQALAMANSELSLQMAREIATQIRAQVAAADRSGDIPFINEAFQWILCRQASDAERTASIAAIIELREAAAEQSDEAKQRRAEANIVHALLNHNDFITVR